MTSAASGTMRPCFAEEDDGLASIGDFSGHRDRRPFICRAGRRGGVGVSSASAAQQHCSEAPHFLQACFLCKKPLAVNCDTFMYRGDMAFCSEECRKEQIEADEAREKMLFLRSRRRNSASAQKHKPTANAAATVAAA